MKRRWFGGALGRGLCAALQLAAVLGWLGTALVPGPASAGAADAQNPAPINAFELDAGRRVDYTPGAKDDSYYRISYKGSLVRERGTPFKFSSGLDLSAPAPVVNSEGTGDRNKWALKYENRAATVGGALLEANGLQPLVLAGIEKLDLRGTASVATDSGGTHLAIGLESPPFRIPGLAGREVTNWIVVGVNAQRDPKAAAAGTTDRSLVTYRAFIGKAFAWRKSADVNKTANRVEQEILKQAPTLAEGKVLVKKIREATATRTPTNLQTLLMDAVDVAGPTEDWRTVVRAVAVQEADVITDQPTVSVYAEATGWYQAGQKVDESRFRNLLTATVDYWFLPARDDVFLRLRYENGYEWSAPRDKRKQLFAAVALRF